MRHINAFQSDIDTMVRNLNYIKKISLARGQLKHILVFVQYLLNITKIIIILNLSSDKFVNMHELNNKRMRLAGVQTV